MPTDKQFTGHQQEGDLYFMQARFYDPEIGRFLQPDTIVPDPMDPQSLNRYSYVLNNPLRYTDPTGRCHEELGYDQLCGHHAHRGDLIAEPVPTPPPQGAQPESVETPTIYIDCLTSLKIEGVGWPLPFFGYPFLGIGGELDKPFEAEASARMNTLTGVVDVQATYADHIGWVATVESYSVTGGLIDIGSLDRPPNGEGISYSLRSSAGSATSTTITYSGQQTIWLDASAYASISFTFGNGQAYASSDISTAGDFHVLLKETPGGGPCN